MKETQSTIRVKSMYSKSGQLIREDSNDEVEVIRMDDVPTATISVDKAITKNLGNFQSLKVSAFISVPCYLNDDQIDRAFEYARNRADAAIIAILEDEGLVKHEQKRS